MPNSSDSWPRRLLYWYDRHARDLPWRRRPTPYRVWISEMMLQQTQVQTVIPYFKRFLRAFPSVRKLAEADLATVLKHWEGLGYYSRARHLHAAARRLCAEHGGRLPRTYDDLLQLPGIGPYCAAAIASIAFGERVPVVDGNVLRVFSRVWMLDDDVRKQRTRQIVFERLQPHVPRRCPGDFNQAMMELGAQVCTPKTPDCGHCPLRKECAAHAANRVSAFPVRAPAGKIPHRHIDVGVVRRNGRILITRRPLDRMLGGLWVLPGGSRRRGERAQAVVARCVHDPPGLNVQPGSIVAAVRHTYSHFSITMTAFECVAPAGRVQNARGESTRWVRPRELSAYAMPTATRRAIDQWLAGESLTHGNGTNRKLRAKSTSSC